MNAVTTIDPKDLVIPQLHGYLLAAVAPRPIAFASTIDRLGCVNLSPFSFFNVFSANPPVMIFSPARRGRNNTNKHTYENVTEVPEVVINIVNHPMAEQMSLASTEYDKGVNEFVKAGFTEVPAQTIRPPRVAEAPVSFECTVDKVIPLGNQGGAGNLVISRVNLIHIHSQYLKADGSLDTTELDLVGRMGENWYCRASGDALFEIPKPLTTKGIGVDQLPLSIRSSHILSANNLGRLGNAEALPTREELDEAMSLPEVRDLMASAGKDKDKTRDTLHQTGRQLLEEGNTRMALAVLVAADNL